MSSPERYVIMNSDGKFACEFGGRQHLRFGDFNPPITTLYYTEREARNVIAELHKRGHFVDDNLNVAKFGIIPLEDTTCAPGA